MDCLMAGILEYQCKIEELEHRRISRESTLKSRYLYWRRKYNELKVTVKKLKGYKGYMKREAQNETRDTQKDS